MLGGIWILQTFPSIVVGLYTRWLHRWALLSGWAVGMTSGTWMARQLAFKATVFPLHLGEVTVPGYAALWALIANLLVAVVGSIVLRALGVPAGRDATKGEDFAAPAVP